MNKNPDDPRPYTIGSVSDIQRNAAGAPVLELPAHWQGLPLSAYPILPQAESGPACVSAPMLLMATSGRGRRWYRFGSHTVELGTAPGMIELYGSDFQRSAARWQGEPGTTVGIVFTRERVSRLAPELSAFELRTAHEVFDPKLQWLTQELVDEALRGAPEGALYAQGLSCALLARLGEHYGAPLERAAIGGLSEACRRRVVELVEARLDEDLDVETLAREADLSPHHFARCFRISMGVTPHRYVQGRRLERALLLLRTTTAPIAEIAYALGFSSQSHFTQVFRLRFGTTPATARKS